MNKHELCQTCKPHGECLFEKAFVKIKKGIPPKKKQTRINPDYSATYEEWDALNLLASARIEARNRGCNRVNDYNITFKSL